MKQCSGVFFKVHYDYGEDACKCGTQKDAELRQAEIRNKQVENGYKPEETHIYLHSWAKIIDEETNRVICDSRTMCFVK